jgi:predicted peptidase
MGWELGEVPRFVPRKHPGDREWPLVVFLHGVGENGTDGRKHLAVGLPRYIADHEETFPAVALFPQCRTAWKYVGEDERRVLDGIEETRRRCRIDARRIYLTGMSQGGSSAFDLAAKHPALWAGVVPVCGAGYAEDAPRITAPLWIFHGEKDPVVPPSGPNRWDDRNLGGRDMAKLIPHAKYTEFEGADHFIWDRVYADPVMWGWLLQQERA